MPVKTEELYSSFIKFLNAAIKRLSMYPPEHPSSQQAVNRPFEVLRKILDNEGQAILTLIENKLVINGVTLEESISGSVLSQTLNKCNVKSLNFTSELNQTRLGTFLRFFVGLDPKAPPPNLPQYLAENGVDSIKVNQLHYELVGEEEKVVSGDAATNIEIKDEIALALKNNPRVLKDLLFDVSFQEQKIKEKFGVPVDASFLVKSAKEQLQKFTDEQLIQLIAQNLQKNLEKNLSQQDPEKKEALKLLKNILEQENKKVFLPHLQKLLERFKMVNDKYFQEIVGERWSSLNKNITEVMQVINNISLGLVTLEELRTLPQNIQKLKDPKLLVHIVERLFTDLESGLENVRSPASLALAVMVNHSLVEKNDELFLTIKNKLHDKVKISNISPHQLAEIAKLFKLVFPVLVKNQNYTEAKDILTCLKWDYQNQPSFPKEKEKEILNVIKEIGSYAIADQLVVHLLASGFSKETKIIEEILFLLGTEGVAQKLAEIFAVEDRIVRLNSLRMLIKIGEPVIPVLNRQLSERRNFARRPNSQQLTNESWYKVRNALFVLANFVDISSVNIIVKLKDDPDLRVRQEVIKALEKQKPDLVIGYLLHYLEDQNASIRKITIETLGILQNPKAVEPLINSFSFKKEDRWEVIKSLTKINGEKAWQFMTDIVTGKEKENWGIAGKISDDIKIAALNGLAKKITPQVIKHLERFIEARKKGFKSIFGMDHLDAEIQKFLSRYKSSAPLSA
ncbi:MAG: hypothetical protein RBG1_1C00001G1446 [candidate division Zixibacteria bacterium RBG-1]|nr:MAG: hypothetical protein RBG1_1C00001G1446 [candidate division Zixibacteria bacterium RBG-1]OGC85192.1 MAG: hypothetical protein A2V73_01150 [candidate division Zixibacteria bacterium RBG_19FT_COMBO_42_43]